MNVGSTIGGYRLERLLGEGGMGAVYLGRHELIGRTAAVKLLLPQFSDHPELVDRFFREARASTAISHPGIVQIFDFGYADDGAAYLVMELLEGESLEARLARLGRLPPEQANRIIRQVGGALQAAHDAGIVHRDLKPDNVFLVPDPDVEGGERAKVLDFGIAKLADPQDATRTKTGTIMGTPVYMAPEQCRGASDVDKRADIYALGCVLFHLLCGRPPFPYEGIGELFVAHMSEPPPPPSQAGAPPGYDAVIAGALAKAPGDRYQTMNSLVDTLTQVQRGQPVVAPAPLAGSAPVAVPRAASAGLSRPLPHHPAHPTPPPYVPPAGRSWLPLILGLALLVAVGGAVAAFALSRGGGPAAPDAAVATSSPDAAPTVPDAAVAAATPDAAPKQVELVVTSKPDGATVREIPGGEVLGETPLRRKRPAGRGTWTFLLEKPGYHSAKVTLSASAGGETGATLVREPPTHTRHGSHSGGDDKRAGDGKKAGGSKDLDAGAGSYR